MKNMLRTVLLFIGLGCIASLANATETIILSDTFEGGTPGAALNGRILNNGLGGAVSATWSDAAGIATVQQSGTNQVCDIAPSSWPTFKVLTSYAIDTNKTYALQFRQKRPTGLIPGNWTPHGGAVILSSSDQWMDYSGIILRLQGSEPSGNDPNLFSVYYNNGTNFWDSLKLNGTINASDLDADGMVPIRMLFTGAGTATAPLYAKLYLNGNYKGSFSVTNLANPGNLVGIVTQSATGYVNGQTDDFRLAEVDNPPAVSIVPIPFPYYGTSATVPLSAAVTLNDLIPLNGGTLTWSQDSGPGTVTFDDEHSPNTHATLSEPGTYSLRLTANSGSQTGSATIQVTLKPLPVLNALLSDDFNGGTAGGYIDGQSLNNALGGSAPATWADALHLAKYAGSGDLVCNLEPNAWDQIKITTTYVTDPATTYCLETLLKPAPGADGAYNRSSGPVLRSASNQNFEAGGLAVRIGNSEANATAPESVNMVSLNGRQTGGFNWNNLQTTSTSVDALADYDGNGFLPVRIEFVGAGTAAQPLRGRLFLNGHERAAFSVANLESTGSQLGFQTALCVGSPMVIANFKLSAIQEVAVPVELSDFSTE